MIDQKEESGHILKKRGKSIIIVFLVLISTLIFPGKLVSQDDDIKFEHLCIEEGLAQGSVYCILQDKLGFIWFGTQQGLNRYDGYTFKPYASDPEKKSSLSHNLVRAICEDRSGIFWIGTHGGGLNKFDPKTEAFTIYKNEAANPTSLSNNNVMVIFEDKFGTLWIGTDDGLNRYNQKTYNFTNYKNNFGYPKGIVRAIYEDKNGVLWIGTDDGLKEYIREEDNFKTYKIDDPKDSYLNKVRAVCEDQFGSLWIGTMGGLRKFDLNKKEIDKEFKPLDGIQVRVIYEDKSGILWIGTRGEGLTRFDPKEKTTKNLRNIPDDNTSLSNNNINTIYQDSSGLIWIGTDGGGLNKFNPTRRKFTLYKNIPGNLDSLNNNEVRAICEGQNGVIWIGTRGGGVNRFDPHSRGKRFTHFPIPSNVSDNPLRNYIHEIFEDVDDENKEGVLWVGTVRAGLFYRRPEDKTFSQLTNRYIGKEEYILSIIEDKDHQLWIGTMDGGLTRLDKNRTNPKNYRYEPNNTESLSSNQVFAILEDSDGVLWVGTGGGGLNKFNREKETFTNYTSDKGRIRLSHNFVIAIFEDKEGTLWIGTNGGGLNRFDKKEVITVYTTQDGLPDNVIYAILKDDKGCLWLSTNRGLSKFDPDNETSINYTVKDGLQGYEFNREAAWKSKAGIMYFGGFNGFNAFKPEEIEHNQFKPPIVITSFNSNESEDFSSSISEIEELKLSYKNTFISFKFSALSYSDPENNRYAYKLEPSKKDWDHLGNRHNVDLKNLKPGKYIFKVKGSNNHGVWNEKGTSIEIIISPPFWVTWWFISLLVVFIVSIFLLLNRSRLSIILKKRKDISDLSDTPKNPEFFSEIVTQNRDMKKIFKYIEAIAASEMPVLITGETGTGKELIAKAIHKASGRTGDFIPRNIAVMDDALFSKQLFGNEKGLGKEAKLKAKGWLKDAKDGTLFLDEIGDISLQSQVKLSGLIPEREFVSPGTEKQLPTDVRLIVATNKDLNILMKEGKFRKDLYYRLIYKIHIPPLRERKDDIPLLVDHFVKESAKLLNKNKPGIPKELSMLLSEYDFPGNVRELAGMVYDAVNMSQSGNLSLKIFYEKIRQ